jgi:hypothetical protein
MKNLVKVFVVVFAITMTSCQSSSSDKTAGDPVDSLSKKEVGITPIDSAGVSVPKDSLVKEE